MTDLLLEATGVVKHYGAVAALRGASLAVRPGEIHALLGANGAGKSTFVKILTGAVHPDAGRFVVRGQERVIGSPAEARRTGLVSVYQEPSLIPDLDVKANLALTATPLEPFLAWVRELGIPDLDLHALARDLPLPILRILDLARALAAEPSVLLLDEMTAALPADLTERVIDVIRRQRGGDRAVIFISHRLIEVTLLCDRATVLRDGETVGVLDVAAGVEDEIVGLMLGPAMNGPTAERAAIERRVAPERAVGPARLVVRNLRAGRKLEDVSFEAHAGEVLGIVALEGQGQDELFSVLSGAERPDGGEILVDGRSVRFRHPGDAIRAGLVYVPANRLEALLPQRSVRENIALPFVAPPRHWGPIPMAAERRRVEEAIRRLQIDTRAAAEVRRLSGGNQQKVTIARWLAFGSQTLLCFDPTRGIDVRTKREIYQLLRELAAAGASVVLYTSELEEIALACDRAIVIFGGRVVGEVPAAEADEGTLLRVAHGLPVAAERPAAPPAAAPQPAGGSLA
ncbi:MAG TPA: sugar ABC transporter ATP-binding protein [Candidatus Binatia bacterium]|nr:sugar ABC transporter ATP-binding protein [Candidatus Binatia bacterium]